MFHNQSFIKYKLFFFGVSFCSVSDVLRTKTESLSFGENKKLTLYFLLDNWFIKKIFIHMMFRDGKKQMKTWVQPENDDEDDDEAMSIRSKVTLVQ